VLKKSLVTRFIGPFSYENLIGQGTFSTPSNTESVEQISQPLPYRYIAYENLGSPSTGEQLEILAFSASYGATVMYG
jgi:hypothetical protein